jgi:hypothetical protein
MRPLSSRQSVRDFVENLEPRTRVIWIANGARGTVQPDKTLRWDDGSTMNHRQMADCPALLINSEAEWYRLHDTLTIMTNCIGCGCTLRRWDAAGCKAGRTQMSCPLEVLPDSDLPPAMPVRQQRVGNLARASGF